jgi:hypothetical protein
MVTVSTTKKYQHMFWKQKLKQKINRDNNKQWE